MSHPRNYELLEGRGGVILTYYQTGAFRVGRWRRGLVKEREKGGGWMDRWVDERPYHA